MIGQNRILWLITILTVVSMVIVCVALTLLYDSAFELQQTRLIETVKSQTSLITAVTRNDKEIALQLLDKDLEYDPFETTINQIQVAHSIQDSLGVKGELVLAKLEGDQIVFLMNHGYHKSDVPLSVSILSPYAEPMKRALRGESGTVVALDYQGVQVLAAYEPVKELGLGIVAKVPLSEIRTPFIRVGLISVGIALALVLFGAILFFRIGNPMVRELIASEAQLRNITATIPGSVYQFVLHKDGSISMPYMSEAFHEITGIKPSIFIEDVTKLYDYIHNDDQASFNESIRRSAETMTSWEYEFRVSTPEKGTLWLNGKSNPSSLPDGSIIFNGVLLDVTKRRQAEMELRESREILNAVLNSIPVRVFWKDKNLKYLGCNTPFAQDAGFEKSEDIIGKSDDEMGWMDQAEFYRAADFEVIESGKAKLHIEEPQTTPSGEQIHLLTSKVPLRDIEGKIVGVLGTYQDITERKLAEEALKISKKEYNDIFDQSPVAIEWYDAEGCLIKVNKSCLDLFGVVNIDEILGFKLFKDPNIPSVLKTKLMKGGRINFEAEFDFEIIKKSKLYQTTCSGIKILDWSITQLVSDGMVTGYIEQILDITERKRAEEALRESEERFKGLVDQSLLSIQIMTIEGATVQVNKAWELLWGATIDNLQNYNILEDEQLENLGIMPYIKRGFKGEQVTIPIVQYNPKNTIEAGSPRWVGGYIYPVRGEDGSIRNIILMHENVTELKRLQTLESRAERLETAGTIAGQVAHDFNNLLAPMIAYPEFIREELPKDHPSLKYLDQIEKAAQKIADINQQLLTLGRRGHYNQDVLNLNTIVQQAVKDMGPLANNVTPEMNLDPDLMNILGGGSQIHRVITNLLCNAVDALQGIGHISVKSENFYVDNISGIYGRVPNGEYVKLTISDTGCGISGDIVQKIIDPFFTTKISDKQRGSGLGLSVVDAVVKDHNGYLDLKTQSGKGTSFYLYFPITRKLFDEYYSDKICGGSETILVVDDDEIQRDVSTQLLKRLGYKVSSVESGEKAIEFLKENSFDLVILDMIMQGGIDGAETYKQLHEFNPNQKAIIVSGFSECDRVKSAQELGAGAFVKKPLTKKALAVAVRTELDKEVKIIV